MNKKRVIQLSVAVLGVIAVIVGIVLLVEFLSWKTIQFTLSPQTSSIKIYDSVLLDKENNEYIDEGGNEDSVKTPTLVATLTGSGTARLKEGRYYVVPSGETIASDVITIDIQTTTTNIAINPYNSSEYLFKTYSSELPAVYASIKKAYPLANKGYEIAKGVFYHSGEWYSTSLHDNSSYASLHGYDTYGVILHKENNVWKVVAGPNLVFSYAGTSSIPADIVDATNRYISGL